MVRLGVSLTAPAGMRSGQRATRGTRMPPSSRSIFWPMKGQLLDHALVGLDGAAVGVLAEAADAPRFLQVVAREPGPVRGAVVQGQVEGLVGRLALDEVHGAAAQQVGEVALFLVRLLVDPEV